MPVFTLHPPLAAWVGQGPGESTQHLAWKMRVLRVSPEMHRALCSSFPVPKYLSRSPQLLLLLSHRHPPEHNQNSQGSLCPPRLSPASSAPCCCSSLSPLLPQPLLSALCRTQSSQNPALFQSPEVLGYARLSSQLFSGLRWVKIILRVSCYSPFLFLSVKT